MPVNDLDHAWGAILRHARSEIQDPAWETWLSVLRPVRADEGRLWVRAPAHAQAWVTDRLLPLLSRSATHVFERPLEVVLEGDGPREGAARGMSGAGGPAPAPRAERPLAARFRFEEFVLGPANHFAHAAALTVAENPGAAYNPLFLCGPPGVGKSHLLHAVGHYARRHHAGIRVRYATAETFANEFIDALRRTGVDAFKDRYRSIDLLLVDDVQFLMAKRATEEEFFHTFNALHEAGAQVVLTADRAPSDLERMEQRLRDRFASGLVVEVERPDLATRLMVLRNRFTGQAIELAEPAALEEIARHVSSSVRALEAALVRVVAFASLTERPLTRSLAQEVLASLYPGRPRPAGGAAPGSPATLAEVLEATALTFSVTEDAILSRRNDRALSWARKLAMYVAREETGASYPALGRDFGGRNHTTVMNAVRGVDARVKHDAGAQVDLARLRARLGGADDRAQDDRAG